jgi:CubicO group peptidase (beta-lactamase class C family)
MLEGMAQEKIPGSAILIMDHGKIILDRGYGLADLATKRPVDPHTTLWPFASITKVVTATALMQLVERGRIGLDTDVNEYLKRARVPAHVGPAVTARHLLTHTDALDELPGRQVESREDLQSLAQFLESRLVLAGQPGEVTRYGTYGFALAGVLIEDVSGVAYADYLRRAIFEPLGMEHTTINIPPDDRGTVATPYERTRDEIQVARYEWYQTTPTSSLVSTVDDMARFMALHLGAEREGNNVVLSASTIHTMAEQHAFIHPALPGWGYGWQLDNTNGRRIIEHGGDIGGFASLMTLLPDEQFGIIVVHHLEGSNLRFALKRAIMDSFFPDRRPPMQPRPATGDASQFAGSYLANNYCRSCPDGAANAQRFEVSVDPHGWLHLWDDRWGEIGPLLFANQDGRRKIGFMRDSHGAIVALSAGAWRVLERAPEPRDGDGANGAAEQP